ncbi:hypothetical protein P171DRAFT_154288 [Karstenula rhodostoma CBS 690.94]|uniref:Myb-like domain-containing protein n=1 Tax=Karstenula rhodostoma CBS 690.94 TaxID=1392251 RepID=A0A9P4P5C8_9PLEO|nr:hypothetical protein P171DRAFT_154288 [Karstenula rhodostoma CBS 690.94]
MHTSTPATSGLFSGISTSRAMSRYSVSAANARAYSQNHGLPMASPMILSEVDYQGGVGHHFDYASPLTGRSTGVKNEADYMDGPLWPLPMQQPALLQPVGTAAGSDIDTGTASLSPRSTYFSEPSEQGTAYSPVPGREVSDSDTWAGQSSVSPTQIKQSPSQSSLSGFRGQLTYAAGGGMGSGVPASRSTRVDVAPSVGQDYGTGFASQVDQFGLPWATVVNQTDSMSALAWQPPMYSQMPPNTQSPYYSTGFVDPFQQSAHNSGSNACGAAVQSREPSREVHRHAPRQDTHGLPRSTDEQAQRDIENRILIEGKSAGLTYKEIRARIMGRFGGEVAESTLRGRHRAMTKQKKDRVRKPTWMPKDLRLLREVVQQQLDSIGDGHRSNDATQRLNKVSWKKVGEHISERGGSYRFGNSTCKKKWMEINQHD